MANLKFPSFKNVYPGERRLLKKIRQRTRFYSSILYCHNEVDMLMNFLNEHPFWLNLFQEKPFRFNTVLHKYCDKRFGKRQRISTILYNLNQFEKLFAESFCQKLLTDKSITLLNIDDELSLNINLNDIEPAEGYFAVSLRYQNQKVYDSSFTLLEPNKLLIASIQGSNAENAQKLIKIVTKKLNGIRPMFMLICLFKMISEHYALQLCAIPHKYQAKYRFNDNARLLFNYDEFWQENGAELKGEYWELSNTIEQKSLDDIPSKKRSMYRKRYEMLDILSQNIKQELLNGR
ncbi:DUF535 family protein [Mannheimia indoligenes]|uniref:DUF535 family protein n=1 Tax=Mannheimia indoligenes TaxID=3103145 RepID=UPI002FE5A3B9